MDAEGQGLGAVAGAVMGAALEGAEGVGACGGFGGAEGVAVGADVDADALRALDVDVELGAALAGGPGELLVAGAALELAEAPALGGEEGEAAAELVGREALEGEAAVLDVVGRLALDGGLGQEGALLGGGARVVDVAEDLDGLRGAAAALAGGLLGGDLGARAGQPGLRARPRPGLLTWARVSTT